VDGIDIDETLVRSLLHEQHPDLAGLALGEVDGGWDNRMWRLGEDLAVRLPRTPRAPSDRAPITSPQSAASLAGAALKRVLAEE
jgi:aminoglycoside phosphotransferase (APT) family kinase protein